jgi:glucoamylase
MSTTPHWRAHVTDLTAGVAKACPQIAVQQLDLPTIAGHMFPLMLRNVASKGYVFEHAGSFSLPGCVIAAPSFPANTPGIDQDYVFNWTRDAAITAMAITANLAARPGAAVQPVSCEQLQRRLIDYVGFAQTCQNNGTPTLGQACFTISGEPRLNWPEPQNDGPALQTIAILRAFDQLDAPTQGIAKSVIAKNIEYLPCCLTSRCARSLIR